MLVNPKELLKQTQKKHLAIGCFNVYNLETTKAVIQAASNVNAPVIIATTPKTIEYIGLEEIATMVKIMAEKAPIPIVLHLDHGLTIEIAQECLEQGYTSIMIDGSHLPLLENIALTQKVVEIASKKKIPVEGELGSIDTPSKLTNPADVPLFLKKTGVFSLAVAIGSSHGHAPKEELNLELLEQIRRKTNVPLVLHGASGVSDADIKGAIQRGITKINVDTELREVFTNAIKEAMSYSQVLDPRQYLKKAQEAVRKKVEEKILLFGSMNV